MTVIRFEGLDEVRALMEQAGPRSKIVLRRTLKKTAKHAQVEGTKAIRKQVNLKAAYVKEKLRIVPASADGLILKIVVPHRGRLLSRFPYTKLKNSVTVKVKPIGARGKLPGAFIVPRLKHSHVPGIAYRRDGKLDVLHGPSLSQVWDDVQPDVAPDIAEFAGRTIRSELNYILSQA